MAEHTAPTDDAPPASTTRSDAADRASDGATPPAGDASSARAVTIGKPVAEVFAFFSDFSRFSSFMENVERVDMVDDTRSHWVVKAPAGRTVEWDAIVTERRENALIAWTSAEGADVANSGHVEFRDAGPRGTIVTATIVYDPPGGMIGKLVAKLFQREPAIQARRDLNRLKQLMETGEIATPAMNPKQFEEMGL